MNILDKLIDATKGRIERDKEKMPAFPEAAPRALKAFAFEKALRAQGMSLICEVKKASPSKGIITENFLYLDIAGEYESAGAAAISVLTETDYFLGSDLYFEEIRKAIKIPMLRKDFIIDPYQIEQSFYLGADAILLIAGILSPAQLREYLVMATDFGISCLVETHDEKELKTAVDAGARIIGVNNRDLRTFEVDFQNSIRLRRLAPKEVVFVAESGVKTPADIQLLYENEIDAALIGEALMTSDNRTAALKALKGGY
ncbi:MAG TPA: indole-3-glycerol phosphate synthase TrpC [Clostridiales bacterium]|nr:indole-3-glycerol phosphate synthase TrpC [Clostridiales bacterium]